MTRRVMSPSTLQTPGRVRGAQPTGGADAGEQRDWAAESRAPSDAPHIGSPPSKRPRKPQPGAFHLRGGNHVSPASPLLLGSGTAIARLASRPAKPAFGRDPMRANLGRAKTPGRARRVGRWGGRVAPMAAVDFFIKFDGIKGESADAKHKDEIDVESWS